MTYLQIMTYLQLPHAGNRVLLACLQELRRNKIDAYLVNATLPNALGTFEVQNESKKEALKIIGKYKKRANQHL